MQTLINNRWFSIISLLLIIANIFTLTLLWLHKKHDGNFLLPPPNKGTQVFEFVTKELQLDSAQKQAYTQLRNQHQAGQAFLLDSIKIEKDRFFNLLKQQNVTDKQLQELSNNVALAEQKLDIFTFNHFKNLRNICNAQQQSKFDNIIEEVIHQMAFSKRPQGPPPPPKMGDDKMPPPDDRDMPNKNDAPLPKK